MGGLDEWGESPRYAAAMWRQRWFLSPEYIGNDPGQRPKGPPKAVRIVSDHWRTDSNVIVTIWLAACFNRQKRVINTDSRRAVDRL